MAAACWTGRARGAVGWHHLKAQLVLLRRAAAAPPPPLLRLQPSPSATCVLALLGYLGGPLTGLLLQ
jgi:hypothetical protein